MFQQFQIPGFSGNIINGGQSNNNGQIKIIGNYQYNLRHCLGEGAYGKVFEGIEKTTQAKVAIKKLDIRQFQNDTYLRNSIISEIEILKIFNHRNIVKFIDMITTQRSLYIITEFCKDGDLRQLIQNKKLTEDQALRVLRDIVEGFKELVKHNVTHRDLKPANILKNEGVFKIADFGFAKYVDYSSAQLLRSCVGSPLYMAPQILARKPYGLKSDVWSIGVIFHEMLYHDVPWKARDERELLNNIMKSPYKLKKSIKLSSLSEDILRRTLVNEEKERISWEELFKMFEQFDLETKNQPNPFGQGPINNKENNQPSIKSLQSNVTGQPQYQPPSTIPTITNMQQNKMKKSIFENTSGIVGNNGLGQGNLRRQTSAPNGNVNNFVQNGAGNRQFETKRLFTLINSKRQAVSFRNFICVDLFSKIKRNVLFMNNSYLSYEKFLLVLSASVKSEMNSLLGELSESEQEFKELYQNSKELKALSSTIKREEEFYKQFVEEFLTYIRNGNMIDQLKSDREVSFIIQNNSFSDFNSDQERQKIDDFIGILGNSIAKEMLNEVKKGISNSKNQSESEQLRGQIVSAEYILDLIEVKKKMCKGAEVSFDQLHHQKSEHSSVNVHFDKAFNKIPNFFNLL